MFIKKIYEFLRKSPEYKVIVDVEDHYLNLAKKYNLRVIGSYNPKKLMLPKNSFYDGMHPRREAIDVLMSSNIHGE